MLKNNTYIGGIDLVVMVSKQGLIENYGIFSLNID